jgi:hypothetical protein
MVFRLATGLLGVGTCMLLLGCGGGPSDTSHSTSESPAPVDNHAAAHNHAALGPHGGHVIMLGEEEYHAELTHDEASHTVAVYLLDSAAKETLPNGPAEITLQVFKGGDFADHILKSSDEAGMFAVSDEALCDFLLHEAEVKGRIRAEIDGKQYVGVVEHTAHAHEGHDHGSEESGHDHDGHGHDSEGAGHDHGPEDAGHDHDGDGHKH